jgi:hypothetical protein
MSVGGSVIRGVAVPAVRIFTKLHAYCPGSPVGAIASNETLFPESVEGTLSTVHIEAVCADELEAVLRHLGDDDMR